MTLQQLIYFQEIARTLSFKHAAENLFVSQSALSYAMQILESELNSPLFIRQKGKRVSLSNYGKLFLPYVESCLSQLNEGVESLKALTIPTKDTVKVAYTFINGSREIPKIFHEFYANTTNRNILLQSIVNHGGNALFIEDQLINGDADLAFSCYQFNENGNIQSEKIWEQQMYIVLPSKHKMSNKAKLSLNDIKDEFLILMNNSMGL